MDSEELAAVLKQKIEDARKSGPKQLPYNRIARAKVDPNRVTGNTRHYKDGVLQSPPATVEIVTLGSSEGYYLLYLDASGDEMNDGYHSSVQEAMEQANYEFGLLAWERFDQEPLS